MGIADVRNAFIAASHGRLTCSDATMEYENGGSHMVYKFRGHHLDGAEFAIVSDPIEASRDPQVVASELALAELARHDAEPPDPDPAQQALPLPEASQS